MEKKELLAKTLVRTGGDRLLSASFGSWRGLLCFNYHRIGDSSSSPFDRALWSATEDEFDRQIRFFKKHFDLITTEDLDDFWNGSRAQAIMLTFDDGYRDNFELAFPILASHGVPAVFFLTSGFLDDRPLSWWDELAWMVHSAQVPELAATTWFERQELSADRESVIVGLLNVLKHLPLNEMAPFLDTLGEVCGTGRAPSDVADQMWMSWDHVRVMDQHGMDFGGHSVQHPVLANCDPETQRREINDSKARIEQQLGRDLTAFSYPVGQIDSFTELTKILLQEAGYRYAFSFYGGLGSPSSLDPFDLPRNGVSPHVSHDLLRATTWLPTIFA